MLILFVAGGVSSFTREDTLRCVSTFSAAGRSAAIDMVLTGGNGVRTATWTDKVWVTNEQQYTHHLCVLHKVLTNVGVIKASRDQSILGPEIPGSGRVAAIASVIKKNKISHSDIFFIPAWCQHKQVVLRHAKIKKYASTNIGELVDS